MRIEEGGKPEGRPIMADPKVCYRRLILKIGVIELRFERLFAFGIKGQSGLDGQDRKIAGRLGKTLHVVEPQARFLHDLHLVLRVEDQFIPSARIAGDPLSLKIEKGALRERQFSANEKKQQREKRDRFRH